MQAPLVHAEGIKIVMITGDNQITANSVAGRLGVDQVHDEVLPEQKAELIKKLQAEGHIIAMAGDGINDASALAQAHVGIAMGTGTDVAIESAGITLVKGDLRGIVRAKRLSRATMRNIQAEPVLCLLLQHGRGADRCGGPVSILRHTVVADDRRGSNELQLRFRDQQFAEAEAGEIMSCMWHGRCILYTRSEEKS